MSMTRRDLLAASGSGFGSLALAAMLAGERDAAAATGGTAVHPACVFPPKVKRVVQLFMAGAASHIDLFDYKPELVRQHGKPSDFGEPVEAFQNGLGPWLKPIWDFKPYGGCGKLLSEPVAALGDVVDRLAFIHNMVSTSGVHSAATLLQTTGFVLPGFPGAGCWVSYALGSMNDNLPTFVVLVARSSKPEQPQAIGARLWSSGFLPGEYSGVSFRSAGDPILYINNPPGVPSAVRRATLDGLQALNQRTLEKIGDPETRTRIAQYEMAFRMQASVPDLTNLATESAATLALYGPDATNPGTFANSALMARRMVERGVRFVQIYLNHWDTHANVVGRLKNGCRDIDQPCFGLIQDLKARGLLDDTLVIWGGEFGRTVYSQGGLTKENYGRDHHPRCFTMWMAGGGARGGTIHGETDDFSYNIVKDPVHIRDFHATVLHLLGFDHERFTYRYLGLDQRLTGVEHARVVTELLA